MDPQLIFSGIQLCWRVGKILFEYCQTWKAAEQEIAECITLVENAWHRTRLQMEFVESIELDDHFRRVLDDSFGILAMKLSEVIKNINEALKKDSGKRPGFLEFAKKVKKPRYLLVKETIDEAITTIERWQRQVDPPWFLMMRISNPKVDEQLGRLVKEDASLNNRSLPSPSSLVDTLSSPSPPPSREITVSNESLPLKVAEGMRDVLRHKPEIHTFLSPLDLQTQNILYSTSQLARPRNVRNAKWLIIDSIKCRPGGRPDALMGDVRTLARKLSKADPLRFGLLNCKGVIKVPANPEQSQPASFDFVFQCPAGMEVLQSLRQKMLDNPGVVSLSQRVSIAKELARSVSYVHTFSFVHKNIRPESVLLFEDRAAARSLTFLVGFDYFRSANGHTSLRGDKEWDRNMYRHPSRQGDFLGEEYKMHHDIYSLGVCLLEIGLWESFVRYDDTASPMPGPRLIGGFQSWLQKNGYNADMLVTCYLKDYFIDLAKSSLPQSVGDRYSDVVVRCLTCLEEGRSEFEDLDEAQDKDGILIGVRFIQQILMRLEEVMI